MVVLQHSSLLNVSEFVFRAAAGRKARFAHYAVLTYAVQDVCHLHVTYSYLRYLESEA